MNAVTMAQRVDRPWLTAYPPGVPADLPASDYPSLVALMEESFARYKERVAYSFMGKDVTFGQTDQLSTALGAYLQRLGLVKGDRIAIMMPNVPQYPVAVAAILRAGFVVVNVNPLYTPRELEHQLKDSGAKAIVIIENFAHTLEQCIANTPIKHVVLCAMGDLLGWLKGTLVNYVVRNVKKMVPVFNLPGAIRFNDAVSQGKQVALKRPDLHPSDIAVLQYTGGKNLLIPNPRDLPAVLKELAKHKVHSFPAVNTLFNGLANHADFNTVDWSHLKISLGGGTAVQAAVAKLWLEKTGCPICEGYGLSETSPSASCNPTNSKVFTGTIGVPIPGTWFKLLDDDGNEVPQGRPGEIAIKGPQVMAGYWQRPDETAKVMTPDGYFKSGDIGIVDESGFFKIVDRKKDMILVSGFNVYPNEIEDVVGQMPGVMECACVGVADERTSEAVKLVIVKKNPNLTEADVRAYCKEALTGYKQPKVVEFRTELPKTPVGKILRRELRDKK